ncbi:MAG: hypothetical protein M3N51_08620 [Actinomycetota bacterium]|nr:hypothetical protein [Actinomycetota bacterium]
MTVDSRLHSGLLMVTGVAEVQLKGNEERPSAVRVLLQPGADAGSVLEDVQRVLADHGLRVRLAPPRVKLEPLLPPPPPSGRSAPLASPHDDRQVAEQTPPTPGPRQQEAAELDFVRVEESAERLRVTAGRSDGATITRQGRPSPRDLQQTIVTAVAALAVPEGERAPTLVSLKEAEVAGHRVLTVVMENEDGRLQTGSSVVEGGWAFALARAVWMAVTPER